MRPGSGHANWCRCAGRRADIAGTEAGLLKFDAAAIGICAAIAGIIWIALAPLRIWHKTGADGQVHPDTATWIAYGISGGLILLLLMFFSIRAAGKRERAACPVRTPAAAEAMEIARALPPDPLPCYHLDAVPVDLSTGERVAWWCQECETQLDADFGRLVRPCCGSAPGTRHQYNCPHRKEQQR